MTEEERKCPTCLGKGNCRNCGGKGCDLCNHTGKCQRCGGSGKKPLFVHEKDTDR